MTAAVRTTCPYCGVGCGVLAAPAQDSAVISGDTAHPANAGRLCSKGAALADVLDPTPRLKHPMIDGARVSWDNALDQVAERIRCTVERYGPDSIAFYVSGQILTEDYYVVNKLAKGFLGCRHVDTNSRLCMASTVVGHKRAFGEDVVPGLYEDLDEAEVIVLVGSNLAWCHPILHRRVEAAMARGTKLVVIDPRRTDSCDGAHMHLPLASGSDVPLFNGLLAALEQAGKIDRDWAEQHTNGLDAALEAARAEAPKVAELCQLDPALLEEFYALFANTEKVVTVFSQGVNQSASGSDKVNAIINVHLATGRIGRPGMGPFSVTGQPNAMGGREVGGLANQLAAHMDPDNPTHVDRVRRFWDAPALQQGQGLKAVDMFKAIGEGKIKLVWVMATNPAVSLPASAKVREALETCPTVIVSDVTAETDTAAYADILLPAAGWGEKDGTVTNSERCISRQRGFRPPVGEAKPDWWALTQVAHRLGFERAFAYDSPVDVFVEHAALSAFENDGERAFDIGGLIDLDRAAYDALEPIRWPVPAPSAPKQPLQGAGRLFAEGGFTHPDGKAKLLPVQHRPLKEAVDERFDLVLNTGRYRDQWHTMTRTGLSARLSAHRPEPLLEVNPEDAAARGMAEDQVVSLHSVHGTVMARLRLTANQPRGQVFLPIHWTDAFASDAITSRLIAPHVDPLSGQPESKASPVRLEALGPVREGIAFTKSALRPEGVLRWARVEGSDAVATHLVLDCTQNAIDGLPERPADLTYEDPQRGSLSSVWLQGDDLEAVLYLGSIKDRISEAWVQERFATPLSHQDRYALLAGRAPGAVADVGRIVCSCQTVGEKTIRAAIAAGADTVDAIAAETAAGTGCGSCRAELGEILTDATRIAAAAE